MIVWFICCCWCCGDLFTFFFAYPSSLCCFWNSSSITLAERKMKPYEMHGSSSKQRRTINTSVDDQTPMREWSEERKKECLYMYIVKSDQNRKEKSGCHVFACMWLTYSLSSAVHENHNHYDTKWWLDYGSHRAATNKQYNSITKSINNEHTFASYSLILMLFKEGMQIERKRKKTIIMWLNRSINWIIASKPSHTNPFMSTVCL